MTNDHGQTAQTFAPIGIDIAKDVFYIVGFDAAGKVVLHKKFKRLALEAEALAMFKKPWLAWAFIVIGNIFKLSNWQAAHRNCYLVSCDWISPTAIIFGVIAFIVAAVWWSQTSPEERTGTTKFFEAAAVVAAIHLILNGAGLVGPDPCPQIDPNCVR